jgi:glutamate---cysteine ligase / carboxylate-amine ligase
MDLALDLSACRRIEPLEDETAAVAQRAGDRVDQVQLLFDAKRERDALPEAPGAREITLRAWPRSDAPRAMADYDDFAAFARRLTAVADVPDYTFHWWKLRPHPKLGTVEIRALDVQAAPAHTAALVAAVHALARHEALADPGSIPPSPPPEIVEEACFRAARNGVDALLPDAEYRLRPVPELLEATLELARPSARELGCEAELDGLTALMETGGGAGLQRRAAGPASDLDALLSHLMECSAVG